MATYVTASAPAPESCDIHGGAPAWAVERARQIVAPDETFLGIYVVSDKNATNATGAPCFIYCVPWITTCFTPFWWVGAIGCCCAGVNLCWYRDLVKSRIYIITDKKLYRAENPEAAAKAPPCWRHTYDAPDADSIRERAALLEDVTTVYAGHGCSWPCCPTEQVVVGLPPGHPHANIGGGKSLNKSAEIYCDVRCCKLIERCGSGLP